MRILLSLATAITILAVALVLLLTPAWTHFALQNGNERAQIPASFIVENSDLTINALVFTGRFDFPGAGTTNDGGPFHGADEQAHMRDVRVVLYGFLLLAAASLVFVVAALLRGSRDSARWKAVGRGGIWLIVAMVVLGFFAFFAFETVFTLFHEIFFPGGNWSFPDTSSLIELYPEPFWELSAAALGILASVGGLIVWFVARRRAAALTAA